MFYSEAILSRRGPLAKVWLAAHMERKLSKTQTLQTDIEQSVDAIMHQEIEVMALRLSGQLLLGVVRIYSRKAKYLLDDCNEALLKIKMAFRPGLVDMTEDQLAVNQNAITLQSNNLDLDALLPDLDWDTADFESRNVQPGGQHIARAADITLGNADLQFEFDDAEYGFDLGPSDGIGSQDYDIDLNIDFGDGPATPAAHTPSRMDDDDDMSVEMPRERAAPRALRESLGSHLLGAQGGDELDLLSVRSRAQSENPFDADVDMGFGPDDAGMVVDLGISFGDEPLLEEPLSEHAPTPRLTPSRASSPLTEPPQTPPPDVELTPKVVPEEVAKKQRKEKKQIIDSVTELADGPGARVGRGRNAGLGAPVTKDVSEIVTEHPTLPRSSLVMRLLEIRDDPLAHFLPMKTTAHGTFFYAAPPGLVPELADMFMRPITNLSAAKRRGASPEKPPSKKRRIDGSVVDEEEVEQARRESRAPSVALGSDVYGRASIGPGADFQFDTTGAGVEDFQMEIPEFHGPEEQRERSKSLAPSELTRLSEPPPDPFLEEGDESHADVTCPIALFDDRTVASQSQTQSQAPSELSDDGKGYSKNTVKALAVIRRELQPNPEEPEEDKYMSFNNMAQKASRRAAAAFFFELLVLGTRDCVKLTQPEPFSNIEVRAKDKLWERQRHGSMAPSSTNGFPRMSQAPSVGPSRRQGSAAPSIASAFGL
ncbi:Rec8 like protein-domain-containing protein [Ganoderma leucocontextum]|nr:Rec8 like protein-domain-containing protein [Ganoderma leucocontextum]